MLVINIKNLGITEMQLKEANELDMWTLGRVTAQYKNMYRVITDEGELLGSVSGKYRYNHSEGIDYPSVGDFVLIGIKQDRCTIHHLISRRSSMFRKVAGNTSEKQIIATNIDNIFICISLNADFNMRRLERYISMALESNATPIIVLTKSDLADDIDISLEVVKSIATDIKIISTTNTKENGYVDIEEYLMGKTSVFIGSSGVGKSTLINYFLGNEITATQDTRNDDKGKHTTTNRELFILENNSIIIDTPGMRELGIVEADLSSTFTDIEDLARECRFNDCSHKKEPGCAIREAIACGDLSPERFKSYEKLMRENKYNQQKNKRKKDR